MPRWVLGVLVGSLAVCVSCVAVGYFVARTAVSTGRGAVADEMADAVAASLARRIRASPRAADRVVIRPADLNVNNAEGSGGAGIQTGTDGTMIWGVVTEIGPAGIALVMGETRYSAVPVVAEGRVELTEVEATEDLSRFFLSKEGFARGMEDGINRALARLGLTPTALALGEGTMTIRFERTTRSPAPAVGNR